MIVDYTTAIEYLFSFADFERTSKSRREAEQFALTRITSLLRRLDRPQDGRITVHVAGSKGKGSSAALIESICRAAGLRTGLFTSPDLHSKSERIRIDGEPLSEAAFTDLVERLRPVIDQELTEDSGRISTFEILTAMGFLAFRDADVEIQIVEVGLGGRLDTTNVFGEKSVGVVTALSREHTDVRGDSMEKIAAEKAGILTAGTLVAVMGAQRSEPAAKVVREHAADVPVPLIDVARAYRWQPAGTDLLQREGAPDSLGQWFRLHRIDVAGNSIDAGLFLTGLLGLHQIENAATSIAVFDALREQCLKIDDAAVHTGLATVAWPARMEIVGREPWWLIDCAHNEESIERVIESLPLYFDYQRTVFVLGVLGDKDLQGMAAHLRVAADAIVVTRPEHPRALAVEETAVAFESWDGVLHVASDVESALQAARDLAGPDDLVCVLGSLFTAAEARAAIERQAGGEPTSARADR